MINKIIIVGGGSSGWMTAAAIKHKFPEINLTLIESKKIPTIGVGESTLGFINEYFSLLDLHDDEWMSECDATYKNSIQFTNFHKPNTKFQYPLLPNNFSEDIIYLTYITHLKYDSASFADKEVVDF